ncbi:MAG: MBL fold metallo-hydrolase [Labilithrix sp.]|nr:MBL fold metallo-hydrolase [Labilithrix sp.]MCW5809636.1 MBL fold metallo-hydrolase [Labilithrix sp.]
MPIDLRDERVTGSANWRDGVFHNTEPRLALDSAKRRSMMSTTGEYLFGGKQKRPPGAMPLERPHEAWSKRPETGLRTTWLGHSTTLLEIDGWRVLTDPVWSERISPVSFAGPRRFHAAPAAIAELPPIDAVLISHDHYDHLDLPSVRALAHTIGAKVPFVTSLGVGARLEALGIPPARIVELDWWEKTAVPGTGLVLHATPSRHFSGRSPFDRNRTLWSSWVIEGTRHRVFFSGDTGLTRDFETIRERVIDGGRFDLVMLEIGAFHEAWGDIHLGPVNALAAHRMLGGGTLLPVHWGTFDLALHAWDEPAETLVAHAAGTHVVTPRLGRAIEPVRIERIDPWWREVARAPSRLAAPQGGLA